MKVFYSVKYGLTRGIEELHVDEAYNSAVKPNGILGFIIERDSKSGGSLMQEFVNNKHLCSTIKEAQDRIEDMRNKKIESLKKQIKKLEKYDPATVVCDVTVQRPG